MKRWIAPLLLAAWCLLQTGCGNLIMLGLLTWLVIERWDEIKDEDPEDWFFSVEEQAPRGPHGFVGVPLDLAVDLTGPTGAIARLQVVDTDDQVQWEALVTIDDAGVGRGRIDWVPQTAGTYRVRVLGGRHELPGVDGQDGALIIADLPHAAG